MQPVESLAPGSIFAKDFRVVRMLAQGGMGAVYEAEQSDNRQRVALKLMHPSQVSDPKLRMRFAQEARVGAWIGSEHIVEVYRAGIDEATHIPWLAMELLRGETLAARIARALPAKGIPHDDAWRVLAQLCRALIAAHEKGVVHRDLKPENVFLTSQARSDSPFTVKILDFGIAKLLSPTDHAKNRTTAIGTPLWMAPEQNADAELTPAADVWAMGLVTFRMFTGHFYWLSANEAELNLGWLYSELVTEALPPATYRADALGCLASLPPGFDAWFARCLVRDPTQRFPSAREMTDALTAFAPPTFNPYGRSSMLPPGSSLPPPDVAATREISSPPQAPTMMLSSPPSAVMAPGPSSFAPAPHGPTARTKSRLVLGLLAATVIVAGAVVTFLFLGASSPEPGAPVVDAGLITVPAAVQVPSMPMNGIPSPGPIGPVTPGPVPQDPTPLTNTGK